jgi:hypothetical protein
MKSSEASTLEVVHGIKEIIPRLQEVLPKDVKAKLVIDASIANQLTLAHLCNCGTINSSPASSQYSTFPYEFFTISCFAHTRQMPCTVCVHDPQF